jgi:hypothetical protein
MRFVVLEDQMCAFTSDFDRARAGCSPDCVDRIKWATEQRMGNAAVDLGPACTIARSTGVDGQRYFPEITQMQNATSATAGRPFLGLDGNKTPGCVTASAERPHPNSM